MTLKSFKKLHFFREVFLLAIIVYFAQGAIYPKGSIISQLALLIILGMSSFFCVMVIASKTSKQIAVWIWFLMLVINVIGYMLALGLSGYNHFGPLKSILIFFLPLFATYYMAQKDAMSETHLVRFLIMILPVAILSFQFAKESILTSRLSDREEVVNNTAYYFVMLIPYVFFFKRKIASALVMVVVLLFIIQGAKRGAVIVGAVGTLFFAYYTLKTIDSKKRVVGYITAFISIIILAVSFYNYYLNNEYLLHRMSQITEGGSGRTEIYLNLVEAWYNSDSVLHYIFGHGFASTLRLSGSGHFAHNDWLELLTNFGLIGVFLYLTLFLSLAATAINSKLKKYKLILLAVLSMWFVTTMFSMVYTSYSSILYSVILGYLLGNALGHKAGEQRAY